MENDPGITSSLLSFLVQKWIAFFFVLSIRDDTSKFLAEAASTLILRQWSNDQALATPYPPHRAKEGDTVFFYEFYDDNLKLLPYGTHQCYHQLPRTHGIDLEIARLEGFSGWGQSYTFRANDVGKTLTIVDDNCTPGKLVNFTVVAVDENITNPIDTPWGDLDKWSIIDEKPKPFPKYNIHAWLCNATGYEFYDDANSTNALPKEITNYTFGLEEPGSYGPGSHVDVCLALDAAASKDGITISGIRDFYWTNGIGLAVTQQSIYGNLPSDLTSFTIPCVATKWCSFRTILYSDFWISGSDVVIYGEGRAILQYYDYDNTTMRLPEEASFAIDLTFNDMDWTGVRVDLSLPTSVPTPPPKPCVHFPARPIFENWKFPCWDELQAANTCVEENPFECYCFDTERFLESFPRDVSSYFRSAFAVHRGPCDEYFCQIANEVMRLNFDPSNVGKSSCCCHEQTRSYVQCMFRTEWFHDVLQPERYPFIPIAPSDTEEPTSTPSPTSAAEWTCDYYGCDSCKPLPSDAAENTGIVTLQTDTEVLVGGVVAGILVILFLFCLAWKFYRKNQRRKGVNANATNFLNISKDDNMEMAKAEIVLPSVENPAPLTIP